MCIQQVVPSGVAETSALSLCSTQVFYSEVMVAIWKLFELQPSGNVVATLQHLNADLQPTTFLPQLKGVLWYY